MEKNKGAEMSLYGALIAFAILILLFSFFEFFNTSIQIQGMEDSLSSSLSDVCLENTIKDYDYIKYKNDKNIPKQVNKEQYINAIFKATGFKKEGTTWSKGEYSISDAKIEFDSTGYCFKLKYTIHAPFKVLGTQVDIIKIRKIASAALMSTV